MLLIKSITINKKVFCKIILLSIILFFVTPSVFAQHVRTGVYGISQVPVGDAASYFLNASGGGVSAEFSFFQNFGQSIRVHYSSVIPKDERILSAWQFTSTFALLLASRFSAKPCHQRVRQLFSPVRKAYDLVFSIL